MRLLLVTGHEEFTEKIKNAGGQDVQIGRFLTPESALQSQTKLEFEGLVCDEKFFHQMRSHFSNPIFILSSTDASSSWGPALKQGADGVVFTDMGPDANLALIQASLRRWSQKASTRRVLPKYGLTIDLENYRVEIKEKVLDLTLTELKVLKELASEEDRVISREVIQQRVFGQLAPGNRSLDVHVCSLRKKLRPLGLDVESVRGVGYRLQPYAARS